MSIDTSFSRRQFSVLAASCSLSSLIIPASTALAASPTKVLWAGVNFVQDCGQSDEPNCQAIDRIFPNLSPSLKDKGKTKFLYDKLPGKWGALIGKSKQHQIVWDNNAEEEPELKPDLVMILGITSDRSIANKYYPTPNLSFMVYEIQSYLLVVDVKAFEIVQSYPIRILSVGMENGERTDDELKEDLKSKMWRSLSGGENAKPGLIRVPQELQRLFNTIEFNNLKRTNVRVTQVSTTKLARKWINQEHPQAAESSVTEDTRDTDFKFLLGNSATSAISEKFGIGIQPYTPNVSLGIVVEDFANYSGTDGDLEIEDVLLNTGKIDLDIRLTAKGVIFKTQKKKGYKDIFLKKCTILVEVEAGRYKRVYENDEEQSATLIGLPVLKQKLLGVSQELTTGTWSNDWYWALDMHQRLFDWFFSAIAEGKDLSKLMKGERNRLEAREFLTRVYTKDLAKLEKEAGALQQALLSRR